MGSIFVIPAFVYHENVEHLSIRPTVARVKYGVFLKTPKSAYCSFMPAAKQ